MMKFPINMESHNPVMFQENHQPLKIYFTNLICFHGHLEDDVPLKFIIWCPDKIYLGTAGEPGGTPPGGVPIVEQVVCGLALFQNPRSGDLSPVVPSGNSIVIFMEFYSDLNNEIL